MTCKKCKEGKAHHHIIVVDGEVTIVWDVSADGWWGLRYLSNIDNEIFDYVVDYWEE